MNQLEPALLPGRSEKPIAAAPLSGLEAGAFHRLIAPLVDAAAARLLSRAEAIQQRWPAAPFTPRFARDLLWRGMDARLDWMISQSAVLELQVAKLRGELSAPTPRARFDEFVARLGEPGVAGEFFAEYKVLESCVKEALETWVETSAELLERLAADWEAVLAAFGPAAAPGQLVDAGAGAGDLHCGGRAVHLLRFASGFRVVYKPRPVDVHVRFAELVAWLNRQGGPGLEAGRTLAREGYGWLDFVAAQDCAGAAEVERFYRRQGAFLAIFYLLNATDFHRENLIARGEHPIFIDLECLLTPDYGQFSTRSHASLAHFEMHDSVMRVMLLPFFHENAGQVYDPSGLGGEGGQVSVTEVPVWLDPGTDAMRLGKEKPLLEASQNRPTLVGRGVSPIDYRDALAEGFAETYRLLLRHREELLAPGSALQRFADSEVRIVFRASQFYAFILEASYHPDLLRDEAARDRHFDSLAYGLERSKLAEISLAVTPPERRDLWQGDIPLFAADAGSRDVKSGLGEKLPNLLVRSGLEMAAARLHKLSEDDLARQLWYLHGSLAALTIELGAGGLDNFRPALPREGSPRRKALAAAEAVARRLHQTALQDGHEAAWVGLADTAARGWWLRPLDLDLYAGLPGVTLFLAQAGAVLGQPEHTALARRALANLERQLARRRVPFTIGGFDGWGGLVYTWLHLARLWNDRTLVDKALAALPKIEQAILEDDYLDVVRGCAGGIPPLLALYRESGDAKALDLARRMGDRLLEKARTFGEAIWWQTESFPVHPLTGFSHGSAGFAWALAQLYAATQNEAYREAAQQALLFERQFYSEKNRNWMDLRPMKASVGAGDYEEALYSVSWCHGATGIGLSRLRMQAWLDDPELRREAEIAGETALNQGFGVNHCLCHGDLGNLDLLEALGREEGGEAWRQEGEKIANRMLEALPDRGLLCGVSYYVETPGLMDGLAGIGYGLLRLAEPDQVPSILMLDLPQEAGKVDG